MTENEIQREIFDWLVSRGYLVMRINSGRKGAIPFARWQVLGIPVQTAGITDLIAWDWSCIPIVIEAKRPGEVPTDDQKLFMLEAARRGAICIIADSLESLIEQLGVIE